MTETPETPISASQFKSARRLPPWYVGLAITAAAVYAVNLQLRDVGGDAGMANVMSYILFGGSSAIVWGWLVFFSGYSRKARRRFVIVPVVAVALFFACFRILRTSGTLVPEFTWRWAAAPDQRLPAAVVKDDVGVVDLLTTTEQDFPQFLGPHRSAVVSGVDLARDWDANPPRLAWRQPIGAAWSAFAAVNGFAVTMEQRGDAELVTCYSIQSGELQWSHGIKARHATIPGFVGPRSTPTVDGGQVFALGATGVLRCLDGKDGTLLWQRDLLSEQGLDRTMDAKGVTWGRAASPLVVDEKVIIPVGGPQLGPWIALAAFDRDTHETIWEGGDYQAGYSSPTLVEFAGVAQLLIVNQDFVSSHDVETGEVLWEHDWPGSSSMDANVAQPVVIPGDRLLLSKGYGVGAELVQIINDEDEGWVTKTIWKNNRVMKTKFTNLATKDGYAYGLDDGVLSCIEIDSGRRQWKRGRYGQGQILMVGDSLLVMAEDGRLAMAAASPDGYQLFGEMQAIDGQTWNNLCLYGHYLLVRNADEAACYELP